jgi:cytochrome oxidase Cu insertion factor (SCO1/SenC/PrrC family)
MVGVAFNPRTKGDAAGSPEAQIGGHFPLIDDPGKPFTDADLKGKWHLSLSSS